jgi:hypothetical protein
MRVAVALYRCKVRDNYDLPDGCRIIIATDLRPET